ncbi:glycosyltransferase [Halospeciosus flavus]|uniref:Glycosyltransferase n=1 Tax=Halospeciosus flavus TaxID=3032283 RepID=A0ABD5Z539_9EURY|nr:glycosyltransferase [Halospeciosus flavus]
MRVAFVAAETVHHADERRDHATVGEGDVQSTADRLYRLAGLLTDRGHEVVVASAKWWDGLPDEFDHEGVTYVAVAERADSRWFTARLPGVVRRLAPDVVHAVGDRPSHAAAARVGARLAGAPLLVEHYDPPERRGVWADWLSGFAVGGATATVVPTRTVATALREAGVAEDGIGVVADPVEVDLIRETEPAADAGDVVFSRRLDEDANLETLLLALAEFRGYDWSATVVGDGPERERYEKQARDLRIADRVDFVGAKSLAERLAYFRGAHVYVQTARRCSFATDLHRALACGCVGIVEYHAASSAHELVEGDSRGFLATNDEEVVECLVEATDLDRRDLGESGATHDEAAFLDAYLERYRAGQDAYGLL